jgi:transposase
VSYAIAPDRSRVFLFPPCLDDLVPQDHPARFVNDFIDAQDLGKLGFATIRRPTGRPNFAASLLLKVILYCYLNRIRSFREIERACRDNLAVIWLSGMNAPDHNTLWRFWQRNRKPMHELLRRSARVAVEQGLVDMVLHAVDGSKIAARAARAGALHREDLEQELKRVDASIEEMEASLKSDTGADYRLPDRLCDAKQRKEAIQESLRFVDAAGAKHLQPAEPEARMMTCDGKNQFGYNAQAAVETGIGLIVGCEVVNQAHDQNLLAPVIATVEETLGQVAETTVADKGYSSGESLADADSRSYNVVVPLTDNVNPGDDQPFHVSRFTYDEARNCVTCPLGQELCFSNVKKGRHGKGQLLVFVCPHYRSCPRRWDCSSSKRGRTVEISTWHAAVEKQRQKQRNADDTKRMLHRRSATVELVFGFIKETLRFRRWTMRCLEGVRTQWAVLCLVYNLWKLHGLWMAGRFALPACA